jgi:hypothetical protein
VTALVPGTAANAYTMSKTGLTGWTVPATFGAGTPGVDSNITQIAVGPVFASGGFTTNTANLTTTNYVNIGGTKYTFKSVLAATNDIFIGVNYEQTLMNLIMAINGTGVNNVDYITNGPNTQVKALPSLNGNVLTLISLLAGTAQNSISLSTNDPSLTAITATLTGGADLVNLLAGTVKSLPNQTETNFAVTVLQAINGYTSTSGYYAQLIGATVYIYSNANNSFSNDAVVTVTVVGQVAIGFLGMSFSFQQVDPTLGNVETSSAIENVSIDGIKVNTGNVTVNNSSLTTGIAAIATDITANSAAYCGVANGNELYLSRLVTSSDDAPLDVSVVIANSNGKYPLQVSQVGKNQLIAVADPAYVGFLRVPAVGSFQRDSLLNPTSIGTIIGNEILFGGILSPLAPLITSLFGFGNSKKMITLDYSPIIVTCRVSGGYPPYSYNWQLQSGASGFIPQPDASSQSVNFYRKDTSGADTAYFVCTITDNLGNTVDSNTVQIYQP